MCRGNLSILVVSRGGLGLWMQFSDSLRLSSSLVIDPVDMMMMWKVRWIAADRRSDI